jgi:hypothetical protein
MQTAQLTGVSTEAAGLTVSDTYLRTANEAGPDKASQVLASFESNAAANPNSLNKLGDLAKLYDSGNDVAANQASESIARKLSTGADPGTALAETAIPDTTSLAAAGAPTTGGEVAGAAPLGGGTTGGEGAAAVDTTTPPIAGVTTPPPATDAGDEALGAGVSGLTEDAGLDAEAGAEEEEAGAEEEEAGAEEEEAGDEEEEAGAEEEEAGDEEDTGDGGGDGRIT